ncbi:MAG: RNA-dependent DNA polymerase [Myxococcales bacterium]|nr:RNA-dependent DNA polymerase [Myxococcales bacterium]
MVGSPRTRRPSISPGAWAPQGFAWRHPSREVKANLVELELASVLRAANTAARGKRRSGDVAAFLLDGERRCIRLASELRAGTWRPGAARGFEVREPKPRLISALPFADRVVQHLLVGATLPAIEGTFAPQSYACRHGFGAHLCLRAARDFTRRRRFVLRLDFAKFFPSIDHAVLRSLLRPLTSAVWWPITFRILDAPAHVERTLFRFPGDDLLTPIERPHGLPIGNLTSQVWANLMLAPIDHLIASHLGLGTFVRYCDDLLIFDDDPGRLRGAWDAIRERADTLRLRLHPVKCRLHRTSDAVAFLGFVLQRRGDAVSVRLRRENVRRFRARMRELQLLYQVGAISVADITARVRAWLAHARHGHTRTLCRSVLAEFSFTRGDGDDPR